MKAIVCDLDGTLVFSAHGMLTSLAGAFAAQGVTSNLPVTPALIGPSLRETLASLCDGDDPALLDWLTAAFKVHYALDTFAPPLTHKAALIARLLAEGWALQSRWRVCRRSGRGYLDAARAKGLRIGWASLGFGDVAADDDRAQLGVPDTAPLLALR